MSLLEDFCWPRQSGCLGMKSGNGLQWQNCCLEWAFGGCGCPALAWHGFLAEPGMVFNKGRWIFFSLPCTPPAAFQTQLNFRLSWHLAATSSSPRPLWEETLWQVWKLTCFVEHPLLVLKEVATSLSPSPSPWQDAAHCLFSPPTKAPPQGDTSPGHTAMGYTGHRASSNPRSE